jgi:hypothetical protein
MDLKNIAKEVFTGRGVVRDAAKALSVTTAVGLTLAQLGGDDQTSLASNVPSGSGKGIAVTECRVGVEKPGCDPDILAYAKVIQDSNDSVKDAYIRKQPSVKDSLFSAPRLGR